MNFTIFPDGDGFLVTWTNAKGVEISRITGFATHERAEGFIQELLLKFALALQRKN